MPSNTDKPQSAEEILFHQIHQHILEQAKNNGHIDTEAELAARFNITRYKVRKALSVLAQMGSNVLTFIPRLGARSMMPI